MKTIIGHIIAFVLLFNISAQSQTTDEVQKSSSISRAGSITEVENPLDIKLYPNPATSEVNISLENKEGQVITIAVTDITGKLMHLREVKGTGLYEGQINTSSYAPGDYIIIFNNGIAKVVRTINKH
jgi:hypothetical protein